MQYRASHRYAHISPYKARSAASLIRGLDVNRALDLLRLDHSRGAALLSKVLKSAIANAGQDDGVDISRLVVAAAWVDEGPLVHGRARFRPGPMGRVMPIRRRTSHLRVVVAPEGENN